MKYRINGIKTADGPPDYVDFPSLKDAALAWKPGYESVVRVDEHGNEHKLTGEEIDTAAVYFLRASMRRTRRVS